MKDMVGREFEQGRIHDNPGRGWLGRGSNELGRGSNETYDYGRGTNIHEIVISVLFYPKTAQKRKKKNTV